MLLPRRRPRRRRPLLSYCRRHTNRRDRRCRPCRLVRPCPRRRQHRRRLTARCRQRRRGSQSG
ncbi:MAG: hypothetical protein EOP22_13600 [Hyphomicrobiales bacterium]|nr:MAG: hypothetical protein EOP22_13600 [Hyphomicrobiales bacterium]